MKNTSTDKLNISLVKAFGIIEFLARYGTPINAAAISQKLQYNKATTYSLLRTLEELQYVSRDSDGCYNLSSKILEIGSLYNASNSLVQVFNLCCDTMLQKYPNCNFSLGILDIHERYLFKHPRQQRILCFCRHSFPFTRNSCRQDYTGQQF